MPPPYLPEWLVLTWLIGVGASVGSFLNVVIGRLPQGESIVSPGSRCPSCKTPIRWYDNIPILSWIVLRARCRACEAPIAARYPMVEALMALLSVALWFRFGWSWPLLMWWPLTAALLAITFIDIDHWIIPDVIVIPAMIFVGAYAFVPGGVEPTQALIGLSLGAAGALTVLLLASVQGSAIGILVALRGGHEEEKGEKVSAAAFDDDDDDWEPSPDAFPFGPFIVLATLQVVLLPHVFGRTLFFLTDTMTGWLT